MISNRRNFIQSSSSALLLAGLLRNTRNAYAQCEGTVDPNCIIEGAAPLGSFNTDDSDSDFAGSVDDTTVSVDPAGNTTIEFVNPDVIEGNIQSNMTLVNTDCIDTAEFTGGLAVTLDIAALTIGSALGITEALAAAGIVYGVLSAGFLSASRDPAAPGTMSVKLYRPPSTPPILSASLNPLAARLQMSVFHATSMGLALSALTTTHERYLSAVQQATAKATSQTVQAVKVQAVAMASNASACASLCRALASDMQQLSSLLSGISATPPKVWPPKSLSSGQIAAELQKAWPSQREVLANTYNYGPNSLAAAGKISQAIAINTSNMTSLQVRGAEGLISVSVSPTVSQLVQISSAAGTSFSNSGNGFSALTQTINNAVWPNPITVTLPHPGSCQPGYTMIHGKCVRGSPQ